MAVPDLESLVAEVDGGDPLDRLDAAERLADDLRGLADRLVGRFVDDARTAGCSWADIGDHLQISRQAAQQRYTPRWSSLDLADLAAAGRLSRYTEKARAVLVRADGLARDLGHADVAPAHLLAAVLDGDNVAVQALRALGADPARLRRAAARAIGRGTATGDRPVPVGAPARRCLEATLAEALQLGHNYIGTEHLLLGLLHDDGIATLAGRKVTLDGARGAVRACLEAVVRARS
jgi:hypothetical protein